MCNETKRWYKSKTVWINILTIGGAVVAGGVGLVPTLQPLIAPHIYPWLLFGVGLANVVLRSVTDQVITWRDGDHADLD